MESLRSFIYLHPYFSMLIFTCIGFLLRGMSRVNLIAVKMNIEDLEAALHDSDIKRAKDSLQRLKTGFGFKDN